MKEPIYLSQYLRFLARNWQLVLLTCFASMIVTYLMIAAYTGLFRVVLETATGLPPLLSVPSATAAVSRSTGLTAARTARASSRWPRSSRATSRPASDGPRSSSSTRGTDLPCTSTE